MPSSPIFRSWPKPISRYAGLRESTARSLSKRNTRAFATSWRDRGNLQSEIGLSWHAPSHAAQDVVVLDDMVTQRSNDMNENDCAEQVGEDHMRALDPLAYRAIHRRNERRHVDPKEVPGHGDTECRRSHPAGQRHDEHEDVERDMPNFRGHALPRLELGGQLRHRIEPSPKEGND